MQRASRSLFIAALCLSACGAPSATLSDLGGVDGSTVTRRSCSQTLTWKPPHAAQKVEVGGEWNKFDPTQTPMQGPDGSGRYTAKLDLQPGAYGYKFVLDGTEWLLDDQNPYEKYVDGTQNSALEVADCKVPLLEFVSLSKTTDGRIAATVRYVDGADGDGLNDWAAVLDGKELDVAGPPGALWKIETSGLATDKHRLVITASDRKGRQAKPLHIPFWIEPEPFDYRDGMLYFAFTDRFADGDPGNNQSVANVDARANFLGGDYVGITQKLDAGYFDALGVRTLWVSPPQLNPNAGYIGSDGRLYSGYHGYWPASPTAIDNRYGGTAALQTLVRKAHARGIRVLVDLVLNHVHEDHPYYAAHKTDGWFSGDGSCVCGPCDWDTHAIDCWFTSYLPDVNYTNFDATEQMIDDALVWMRDFDVDGFRVDAVKHFVLAPTRRLRAKIRAEFELAGPTSYLVGETFTGGDDGGRQLIKNYIGDDKLEAQFDFPIYWNIVGSLGTYSQSLRSLEGAANATDSWFPGAPMSPFFGNHDVSRFITQAAGMLQGDGKEQAWNSPPASPTNAEPYERLRLALTFLMTQPGVPLIYYGDEIGLPGAADPDNRRMMKFEGLSSFEGDTLAHAKQLGAARKELVALRRGARKTIWIDDDLYVYTRQTGTTAGANVAIVAINRGSKRGAPVAVPIPSDVPLADGTVLHDRLSSASLTITSKTLTLDLGDRQSMVLAP